MNQRLRAKRQMRLAASGSIGVLWEYPWKIRSWEFYQKPFPRGLNKPKGAK